MGIYLYEAAGCVGQKVIDLNRNGSGSGSPYAMASRNRPRWNDNALGLKRELRQTQAYDGHLGRRKVGVSVRSITIRAFAQSVPGVHGYLLDHV
jgi:hypothetical protein